MKGPKMGWKKKPTLQNSTWTYVKSCPRKEESLEAVLLLSRWARGLVGSEPSKCDPGQEHPRKVTGAQPVDWIVITPLYSAPRDHI